MGYQFALNLNAFKAVDYTDLGGVAVQVFLETENFSVMTLLTDSTGHVYDNVDRSQYQGTDMPGRLQAYYQKEGYGPGCAACTLDASFLDGNGVKHYVFDVDLLLVGQPEIGPPPIEILPPPEVNP